MLNRFILWLSLAGMILALHLWVQKARGFDQGCLGLSKPALVANLDCQADGLQAASHLFGVSNAAWGYAFYLGLALISFGKVIASPACARRLHLLSEIATIPAVLYSGYLVYTMGFVAHAWCVLCLTSATIITLLFILHALLRVRGGWQPLEESARTEEFRIASGALFAGIGVLIGVLLFVDRLGTRPLDQGSTGKELERIVGDTLPVYLDQEKLMDMRACHLDFTEPVIDPKKFIGPATPFLGKADGIPVIVFYDPNCPHCKTYHQVFKKIIEKNSDRARFYVLPRILWDFSLPEVEALKLAETSGKYFDLWQKFFDHQKKGGLNVTQIAEQFHALGLDTTDLEKRLEAVKPEVLAMLSQMKAAKVNVVPTVSVGNRRVFYINRSEDCVAKIIGRLLNARDKPAPAADEPAAAEK